MIYPSPRGAAGEGPYWQRAGLTAETVADRQSVMSLFEIMGAMERDRLAQDRLGESAVYDRRALLNVIAALLSAQPPASDERLREAERLITVDELGEKLRSADLSLRDYTGRSRSRSKTYWRDMAELTIVLFETRHAALATPPVTSQEPDAPSAQDIIRHAQEHGMEEWATGALSSSQGGREGIDVELLARAIALRLPADLIRRDLHADAIAGEYLRLRATPDGSADPSVTPVTDSEEEAE